MTDNEVKWLIVGKLLRRNLMARKEPVAYLYNGVRLPKLPEWDKTAYPYAVIYPSANPALIVSSEPFVFDASGLKLVGVNAFSAVTYSIISGKWMQFIADDYEAGWKFAVNEVYWSNYDLYDTDGNRYLTASDPIPVYE